MSRVVVTGGCGFIGCNLVRRLVERGVDDIVVLDDESVGRREHVDVDGPLFLTADIRDRPAVDEAIATADAVVHLAAATRVTDSLEDPMRNFEVNVTGTLEVLEGMRRHGCRRVVNASTGGAILGDATPPVHEEMVARPISPYGASKLAAEGYLSAYEGSFALSPISFRFSNVYGPRSYHKGSVVAAFFKAILRDERLIVYGDGAQTRDFVYVDDLTEAIAAALEHDETGVFQLGAGVETSVNELLRRMSAVVGEDLLSRVEYLPARRGEVGRTYCDISLARTRLGFSPQTSLDEGLERTWRWFRDVGVRE